jgi:hypothetical protein
MGHKGPGAACDDEEDVTTEELEDSKIEEAMMEGGVGGFGGQ